MYDDDYYVIVIIFQLLNDKVERVGEGNQTEWTVLMGIDVSEFQVYYRYLSE
jgi:hypothetical protein